MLVSNWKDGWKWFSVWAMLVMTIVAALPLSPELMVQIPAELHSKILFAAGIAGILLRFIKQGPVTPAPIE